MSYLGNIGRALIGRGLGLKASAVGPMLARMALHMPVWSGRDYEKLGREGYQQNAVVARCVQLIAENAATIPWRIVEGRGKNAKKLDEHDLLDLIDNPNPGQEGPDFLTALYSHLMISGNAFVERTAERNLSRMELYAHRPDRMKVVPGAKGLPEGYEYRVGAGIMRFDVDLDRGKRPILHLKKFNPVDDWYGQSPLDPAAWGIDIHNASSAWNKALLDNAAAPSGAFVYKTEDNATMNDDAFRRLKQELLDNVQGARNAGRPLLLEGGLDWKGMGFDPKQMEAVDGKNQAAREIAFAMGVPPMLLGIPGDNTYSNYVEANRAFYRQTVIPLVTWVCRAFENWFEEELGHKAHIVPNIEELDALAVEREALWARIEKSTCLTINEKREALGREKIEGGDELYIGAGLVPLGGDATVAGGMAPDPTEVDPLQQGPGSGQAPAKPKWPRLV